MKARFQPKAICDCKCCKGQYRNCEEARVYGSDLNKFINQICIPDMDVINIDCLQYKASANYGLRLIEYKHDGEKLSDRQNVLLPMFAHQLRFWDNRLVPVYVFTGNYPFNRVKVKDMLTNKEVTIKDMEEVKSWLNFERKL